MPGQAGKQNAEKVVHSQQYNGENAHDVTISKKGGADGNEKQITGNRDNKQERFQV